MVHSSQTATSTEVETWLLLPFTRACFLTTLTFRALGGNHIVTVTLAVYPRLLLHFHIQSYAWTLGYLKKVVMDVYPRLFEIASLCYSEHCTDTNKSI